ncbi:MAG TPA: hypothetical protein VMU19_10965 [Bryobacteraceae bacterium]|nr:hypothetical protein [Bryobacteraceae bacterium]
MPSRPLFRRPAVLLVAALVAVAAVVSLLGRITGGSDVVKPVTLANAGGAEAYPSFSPDGKQLAYSARLVKGQPYHIFVRTLPNGARRQLTTADAGDVAPAWSPDGASIAFLRVTGDGAACMTLPAAGGPERKIADCAAVGADQTEPAVSWTPDSRSLVVAAPGPNGAAALAVVSAAGGVPKTITTPPEGSLGDATPAVSPDGKTVAFVRGAADDNQDIFTCALTGGDPQRLTFDGRGVRGLAWTPDGSHLVYAGHRMGTWRLWRLTAAGGSPRDLGFARDHAQYPAVSPLGGQIAYTDNPTVSAIWRAPLGVENAESTPFLQSAGREAAPSISPDGKSVADISDQSGTDQIWVGDVERHRRTQLTHFEPGAFPGYPRWSPDGETILFDLRTSDVSEVDTIPAAGGTPQRVVLNASAASWSHDGKSVYYQSRGEIYRAQADGSGATAITTRGGAQPSESLDGKYVYYLRQGAIWRVPVAGGDEEAAIQSDRGYIVGGAKLTAKGAYYVEWAGMRRRPAGRGRGMAFNSAPMTLSFYDFATQKTTPVFQADMMDFSGVAIDPQAKYLLYSGSDESETNLMLARGFK